MSSEAAVLEAPAAPAPTPAPVPPVADASTFERDVGTLAPDVLGRLMPAPKPLVRRGAPPAAAPVPEPTPPAAAEVPAAPPTAPEVPVSPEPAKNWRLQAQDAKDALYMQLRKNGASHMEAHGEVYGEPAAAPAAAQPISEPVPQADPVAGIETQITTLAQEVAELNTQSDKAAEDGDTKTALTLNRKANEKTIALERAKDQREAIRRESEDRQVFTAVEQHRQLEQRSLDQTFELYPELEMKTSEQRAQFNLKVREMEADPAYGPKFRERVPGWPLMVARMTDAEKGWKKAPTAPPPVAPAPVPAPKTMSNPPPLVPAPLTVPPVRATAAEVITAGNNPGGTSVTLDAKSFWKDSQNTDPDVLIKLMSRAPIDPRLLQKQKNDMRRHGA